MMKMRVAISITQKSMLIKSFITKGKQSCFWFLHKINIKLFFLINPHIIKYCEDFILNKKNTQLYYYRV